MNLLIKHSYILGILFLTSCSKWVDIERPSNKMGHEDIFSNEHNVTSFILGLYSQQIDYIIPGVTILGGCSSDEMSSELPEFAEYLNNDIVPTQTFYYSPWTNIYPLVAHANIAIYELENNTNLKEEDRKRLLGEAYFVRAFSFFNLLQFYGRIPLTTYADPKENMFLAQSSIEEVWAQIITDAKKSQNNLQDIEIYSNTRANYYTATALLARCYLYKENWEQATLEASKVINASAYSLSELNDLYFSNSIETIFQLETQPYYHPLAFMYLSYDEMYPPSITLRNEFASLFDIQDARFNNFTTLSSTNDRTISKYFDYENQHLILFRLSEMYLIRAEASIQLNRFADANEDLNLLRQRANLDPAEINNTKEGLKAIEYERLAEFFGEYPHRWYDLKRWKGFENTSQTRADEVLSKIPSKNWTPTDKYYPIYFKELLNNIHLQQNDGYN